MKKLLALLMAALVLLSAPVFPALADEGEPVDDASAVETAAEATATPAPADIPVPTETSAPEGTYVSTETHAPGATPEPEETDDPEAAPEPEETDDPEATPALAETDDPEATSEPTEVPDIEEEADGSEEGSKDRPRWGKSLAKWKKERDEIQLTGDLRQDILIIAQSQLGYSADDTYYEEDEETGKKRCYTRYGDWIGLRFADWCDMFVSFCIYYAGNESYPVDSGVGRHMLRLKQAGYWREWNSYIPQKGDIVFFAFDPNTSMPTHVGLVEEVVPGEGNEPGHLITIEGNMPNPKGKTTCVRRMTRPLNAVVGYGTYEPGKIYPEEYTVRSDGWWIIDPDSAFFVEYPQEEVLRFLGLYKSKYYNYWFPEEPVTEAESLPEQLLPEARPAVVPKSKKLNLDMLMRGLDEQK